MGISNDPSKTVCFLKTQLKFKNQVHFSEFSRIIFFEMETCRQCRKVIFQFSIFVSLDLCFFFFVVHFLCFFLNQEYDSYDLAMTLIEFCAVLFNVL